MDKEAAVTMMEAIPPFDWNEVALKKDIEKSFALAKSETKTAIDSAIDKQTIAFQKEIAKATKTFIGWMFAGNSIIVAAFAAIVIFAK